MKKRILSILLLCCMVLTLLPTYAAATETEDTEQFNLEPGNAYYYFYIEEWKSYVRFNYAGTVDAYVLNSRSRGKTKAAEEASENTRNTGTWYGNTYKHSLFIARGTYLTGESWDALNGQGLIFGKTYEINGVKYTMRAPTVGSNYGELEEGWKVTPANNEWDAIRDKGIDILYAGNYASWGQDTAKHDSSFRAARGGGTMENHGPQIWSMYESDETEEKNLRYRPVLEVMNAEELGKDGLKVVALDMNGGNLLPSSVQYPKIIVRGGTATFTAPTATGIKRPWRNTGSYFKWLGDDGVLYEPGAEVPATVTELTAQWNVQEQFSLEPGERYYFDLSKKGLYTASEIRRGKVYKDLPDRTLHYVPFTYAGAVDAYVLNSNAANVAASAAEASATTDPNAQYGYTYKHSLFIADYILKNEVSWKGLNMNKRGWIFGKRYTSNGILYTMRAPTMGSSYDEEDGVMPENNEWDAIADKNSGYIKNWANVYAWGQDSDGKYRLNKAVRGLRKLRGWWNRSQGTSTRVYGYRPVLEVKNADDLGPEALKVVTLQLEEASVGGKNSIKIIVLNGQSFTAPSCEGLTVAEGYDRASFRWKDSDGNLYAPGDSVPATVTELKAQWSVTEQFSLEPGGTYYFDLSAAGGSHYQAFTYVGTVGAYRTVKDSENNEHSGNDPHTLFVSESITRWSVPWHALNGEGLIFGKAYESSGVEYAMRAPAGGNGGGGNNEWDRILDKDESYIKGSFGWGNWCQDRLDVFGHSYTLRGYDGKGARTFDDGMGSHSFYNYRPVLEVMNAKALGQDGLKAVTLQLNGGTVDGKMQIQIIVKGGAAFTAPVLDGIGKPGDYAEGYFQWLGNDGQLYAPGDSVPATVDTLTAQFAPSITTDTLPGGKVDEAYSQTLIANGTTPIIWSVENGGLPAGLSLNKDTGEISGTPTADGTAKFTVKAENCAGSDMKELSITIDKAEPPSHEHSYGDWIADGETGHYRVCTDEYCTSADKGRAAEAHLYDDDADTTCNACGYDRTGTPPSHEHNYGNWNRDDTSHWHECEDADCPDRNESIKDKAAHIYTVYTDDADTTAAEFSDGSDVAAAYVCDVCGYERIVTPPSHEHSYDNWSKDGTSHWHECTDDGCPEKPESVKDKAAHTYTDDADTTCDVCGYERTVTPPVHEHTYSDWTADGETGHYRVCTDEYCTSADKGRVTETHLYDDDADMICNACGYERTATPPSHEHSYGDWSKDDTNHWHECTDNSCPDRDESIKDKAAHVYSVYTDNAAATCNVCGYEHTGTPTVHEHTYSDWTADGETGHYRICTDEYCTSADKGRVAEVHLYDDDADMICNACGYDRTVTPPSHEHNYSNWSRDDTSHWHECTDADCPDRNESIKDKAAHIYTVYTVYTDDADTTAAEFSDGSDVAAAYVCDVCGYERIVTPPSHEHSYDNWSKDGTSHWHECTDADCPDKDESIKDKAAHVYTVYTDNAAATCNICGYEHTGTPPVHEHSYSDWTADGETGHYRICTDENCTSADKGRVTEAHVYTDDADTTAAEFSDGSDVAVAHIYTDDADMICHVCGYKRTGTPPAPTEFTITSDSNGGYNPPATP